MNHSAGARHLADSANWLAWQDDLDRRHLISEATRLDGSPRATLCQLAAAHDGADPLAWLTQFLERLAA